MSSVLSLLVVSAWKNTRPTYTCVSAILGSRLCINTVFFTPFPTSSFRAFDSHRRVSFLAFCEDAEKGGRCFLSRRSRFTSRYNVTPATLQSVNICMQSFTSRPNTGILHLLCIPNLHPKKLCPRAPITVTESSRSTNYPFEQYPFTVSLKNRRGIELKSARGGAITVRSVT